MKALFVLCQGEIARRCLPLLAASRQPRVVGISCPASWKDEVVERFGSSVFVHDSGARDDEGLHDAIAGRADSLLSIQYPWILQARLLALVAGNAFNLHNAALPEYRGHNSLTHVLLNGDDAHRPTLHRMDAEVDRGEICFEANVPIASDETALSLYQKCLPACEQLVKDFLVAAGAGKIPHVRNVGVGGRYYKRDSVRPLKVAPPEADAAYLERLARALYFPPHEPPYLMSGDRKVYLLPEAYAKTHTPSEGR